MSYAPAMLGYANPGRRSAPPSVLAIAVLQYVGGSLALIGAALAGFAAIMVSQDARAEYDVISPEGAARLFGVAAVAAALSGLVALLLGRQVHRGRQWARVVLFVLSGLNVAGVGLSIASAQAVWPYALGLVYPTLCLALLNTRAARLWFRPAS